MSAVPKEAKHDPIDIISLDESFLDLVFSRLLEQTSDGFGPVDPYLAVYFAYLESEERRSGELPSSHPGEHNTILTVMERILKSKRI